MLEQAAWQVASLQGREEPGFNETSSGAYCYSEPLSRDTAHPDGAEIVLTCKKVDLVD